MNSNVLFLLIKNNLLNTFGNSKRNKKRSAKTNVLTFTILFLVLSIMYNFQAIEAFKQYEIIDSYLIIVTAISSMLGIMFTLLKFEQTIFGAKDYEFLESLPITKKTVISSKILTLYIIDLAETLIITVPAMLFFAIYGGSINVIAIFMVSLVFIPLIPLSISGLISYLFTLITGKLKIKNIIIIVLYLLFFVGIFFVSFITGFSGESADALMGLVNDSAKAYPPLYFIIKACNGELIYLLYFIIISIASFALVIYLISLGYHRINNWLISGISHSKYKKQNASNDSSFNVLVKKEWKMLIKKPMYVVNSFLGPLLSLVFVIVFYFVSAQTDLAEATAEEIAEFHTIMSASTVFLLLMMNSIASSTVSTISLEGKSFSFLKSLPLKETTIIKAKLLIAIVIPVALNLIASTVFVCIFDVSWYVVVCAYLFPILGTIFIACLGLLCNLKWPKLDFDNEMQVMKNSTAAMVATFSSLIITFIAYGVGIATAIVGCDYIGYITSLVLYIILDIVVGLILKTKAIKLFSKIEER